MKATPLLRDSQFLAEFVNLDADDSRRAEEFRHNHPDFAPSSWWDYQPTDSNGAALSQKQWQLTQHLVREAWKEQFKSDVGLYRLIRLLLSVFDSDNLTDVMFKSPYRPTVADTNAIAEEYGYHKAIRYLFDAPWRARFCEECGAAYVADHNKRKYCSVAGEDGLNCSAKVIERTHIEWGRANNWGRKSTKVQKVRRREL